MVDGIAGQPGQQVGMAGRVGRVHLVERHHQPAAEEPVPDPVDDRSGEEFALAGLERHLDQAGPGAEARRRRRDFLLLGTLELLLLLLPVGALRVGLGDLPAGQEHHPGLALDALGRLEFDRAVIVFAQEASIAGAVDEGAVEERLHPVEVVLLPVIDQRVVVALGATDIDPEEGRADLGGEPVGVLDARAEVVGGGLLDLVGLVGEHHLAEDPIPRGVLADGLDEIVAETPLLAGHEHGVELGRLVPDEPGRRHQAIDESRLLLGVGRSGVGQRLGRGRDAAGEIERQPAHDRGVIGRRGRLHAFLAEGVV